MLRVLERLVALWSLEAALLCAELSAQSGSRFSLGQWRCSVAFWSACGSFVDSDLGVQGLSLFIE